jgi:hypothetical protein
VNVLNIYADDADDVDDVDDVDNVDDVDDVGDVGDADLAKTLLPTKREFKGRGSQGLRAVGNQSSRESGAVMINSRALATL